MSDNDNDTSDKMKEEEVIEDGVNMAEDEDDSGDDSDRELQIAFKAGLLKSDALNYVVEKKKPLINKKDEIKAKIEMFKKDLPWLETLDVTINNGNTNEKAVNDDFEREIIFYKQAEKAVRMAVTRLCEMNVKILRPADYYAEMVKSDEHMQKVRQRIADIEESKQRQEAIRRIREEKKFATKVQKNATERKQNEKKLLLEAVKQHRKGMKSQLDTMLNNAKRLMDTEGEVENSSETRKSNKKNMLKKGGKRKFNRMARDEKFGFGGQKKRSKKNDKNSFEEVVTPAILSRKLKGHHFGISKSSKHGKRRKG